MSSKQLTPLYERASTGEPTFINLDMEEYHDLDLTVAVFKAVLDSFPDLEAGIVLQAYLPDALGAMQDLQEWATRRRAQGGAPIKVRVVKGANLAMERVDAAVHGWPLATWSTKQETDTNYKRVLDWAMTPERVDAVRLGVAGQNLFDIAYAWLLAGDRGVRDSIDFEMLLGMDSGPIDAVRDDIGQLLLYTPVVHPSEFDVAISYLVRRLEENASSDNFMSAAFELADEPDLLAREIQRFFASVDALDDTVPEPHRTQNRLTEVAPVHSGPFTNTPDTDPSTAGNREWGRLVLARSAYTQLGTETVRANKIPGPASLESVVQDTRVAAKAWEARGVRGARMDPAPGRRRTRRTSRRPRVGHGRRGRQDHRRGRRRGQRGDRLRPLLRRVGAPARGCRRGRVRARHPDGRDSPVELPGGDPGRVGPRRAVRRQRRHHQGSAADPPLCRRHGRGALAGRRTA